MTNEDGKSVDRLRSSASDRLTREQFALRFDEAQQKLWCIAAGVLGRSKRGGADIEDVLQDAAIVGLNKINEYEPNTNFNAWMGQIVRYSALNAARRRNKRNATKSPLYEDSISDLNAPGTGTTQPPVLDTKGDLHDEQQSFDDDVCAALQTLDETARICLLLRTIENMPYRELAQTLDIAEGTAMSHVHRARKALRLHLQGPDSTTREKATPTE